MNSLFGDYRKDSLGASQLRIKRRWFINPLIFRGGVPRPNMTDLLMPASTQALPSEFLTNFLLVDKFTLKISL
jgi:hypothetical protein